MRFIIFDLEATCWKDEQLPAEMETIEIGAVALDENGEVQSEFGCFVRPVVHPQLSDFCRELTSIKQNDVDGAETFAVAFARFVEWAQSGGEPLTLVSWGAFDPRQLQLDCARARRISGEFRASRQHQTALRPRACSDQTRRHGARAEAARNSSRGHASSRHRRCAQYRGNCPDDDGASELARRGLYCFP